MPEFCVFDIGMDLETCKRHWRYFLSLDEQLVDISKYVEVCRDNFATHSIELTKCYLSASSEFEVVCRLLCNAITAKGHGNVSGDKCGHLELVETILDRYPKICEASVYQAELSEELQPLKCWTLENLDRFNSSKKKDRSVLPAWWDNYNNVKHHRDRFFQYGNLENTINANAALMIMLLYLWRVVKDVPYAYPYPSSSFFHSKYAGVLCLERSEYSLPGFEHDEVLISQRVKP